MNALFQLLALAGFLLSLLVHVLSLAHVDVMSRVPAVWGLHFGVFAVFIPFVLALSKQKREGRRLTASEMRALLPAPYAWIAVLLFVYVIVNFALFMAATGHGNAVARDGKYLLMDHGSVERELSADEYARMQANVLRGFSGHWMLFYFLPFAYFRFAVPVSRQAW